MTTVLDRFKDFYPDDWRDVLEFFAGHAYFYSSPTALVCAYTTRRSLVEQKKYEMVVDNFDTWYIHYLAGKVTEVFDIAPSVTKWVCWQRNQSGKDVFIEYEKLRRRYGK
jgi:hypothetical protein